MGTESGKRVDVCICMPDSLLPYSSSEHNIVNVHAQSLQLCPTLFNPVDCSPPGSSVREILQAKILKWVALPSSRNLPNPGFELMSPVSPALQVDSILQ